MKKRKIGHKQFLLISCLLAGAILQFSTSIGSVQQLSRKHTFYEVLKANWTGDGVLLGCFLSEGLKEYQPIKLYYPKGLDNIKTPRTPFWFIYFDSHTQPYLYPGRVEASDYGYILSSERIRKLLDEHKHKVIYGRYQTFVTIYPTSLSSTEYRMYSSEDWKTSIAIPKELW